ncbi:unnamed protein product [Chrysoparadoxa australica]
MHKLTRMEGKRVVAVIDDTLEKLNQLSYVPEDASLELLESLAEASANPVKSCLQTQWHLEMNAINMGVIQGKGGGAGGKSTLDELGAARNSDTLDQIYQSTRLLCRSLKKHQNGLEVLYGYTPVQPRAQGLLQFKQYLSDLTTIMYRRLSTTVEEEQANKNLLRDLTQREKLAEDERDSLQQTLDAARTEREGEVNGLELAIRRLQSELQEVTEETAQELESIRSKADAAIEKAGTEHTQKVKVLEERLETLTKEIGELTESHKDEEASARKKKAKAEVELAAAVKLYDDEMIEKTAMIKELQAAMAAERAELASLTEHFDRVDANTHQMEAEEALLAEVRAVMGEATGVLDASAVRIQCLYRGIQQRAEFAKMKKKGKGKSKGKGGKSKKK